MKGGKERKKGEYSTVKSMGGIVLRVMLEFRGSIKKYFLTRSRCEKLWMLTCCPFPQYSFRCWNIAGMALGSGSRLHYPSGFILSFLNPCHNTSSQIKSAHIRQHHLFMGM